MRLVETRLARQDALVSPRESIRRIRPTLFHDSLGQRPRRLDVGRVVQEHQRLLRDVGTAALAGGFFAAGGVEGGEAGVREGPLPPGVKAAAILVLAVVRFPG